MHGVLTPTEGGSLGLVVVPEEVLEDERNVPGDGLALALLSTLSDAGGRGGGRGQGGGGRERRQQHDRGRVVVVVIIIVVVDVVATCPLQDLPVLGQQTRLRVRAEDIIVKA